VNCAKATSANHGTLAYHLESIMHYPMSIGGACVRACVRGFVFLCLLCVPLRANACVRAKASVRACVRACLLVGVATAVATAVANGDDGYHVVVR
jgi:hypothetical protein